MALAETAKLIVDLSLKGNFASGIGKVSKSVRDLDKDLDHAQSRAYLVGQQIGTGLRRSAYIAAGAVGLLTTQVVLGLRSLEKLELSVAQTNAVLKSTKGIAGVTADEVRRLAEQYERLNATVGDETIQAGENLLLTFTNIRKQAFEPALKAALDLNTALGRGEDSLTDTIRAVGRALNDPAKGLVLLTRLGVQFTDAQKKQIDAALKVNDVYTAQTIILAELNKRFGGSFLAQGNTTAGKVAKFRDAIEDLQRALATALLPTIGKIADRLQTFLADPKITKAVSELGDQIAGLFSDENLSAAADVLRSVFDTARAAAPVVAAAAKTMAEVVKTAVGVFRSLPPEIQQFAIGAFAINKITGGLVTNLASGLIASVLKQLVSGVVNVSGAVVNVVGAGGVPAVGGAAASGAAGAGLGAAAVAVTVPVVLVGGAAVSLESIAGYAGDNNRLAKLGLNQAEIAAQRFYNSNRADQDRIIKHLGYMPTKADFESGNAKIKAALGQGFSNVTTAQYRTKDDLTAAALKQIAADNRILTGVEKARSATVFGANRTVNAVDRARNAQLTSAEHIRSAAFSTGRSITAAVARAREAISRAELATARAVQSKKLSVTVNLPRPTVTVREFASGFRVATNYGGGSGGTKVITQS